MPTSCIICYATQTVEIFHIHKLFRSIVISNGDGSVEILITLVLFHINFHSMASSNFSCAISYAQWHVASSASSTRLSAYFILRISCHLVRICFKGSFCYYSQHFHCIPSFFSSSKSKLIYSRYILNFPFSPFTKCPRCWLCSVVFFKAVIPWATVQFQICCCDLTQACSWSGYSPYVMWYVVGKMAVRRVFPVVLRFSLFIIVPPICTLTFVVGLLFSETQALNSKVPSYWLFKR